MQNAECKMQNYGISSGNNLNIWAKPIPLFCILHLSFCILLFETKFQTTICRTRSIWKSLSGEVYKMEEKYCPNCMKPIRGGICPHCGCRADQPNPGDLLAVGTVIAGLERRLWDAVARDYASSRNILHFEQALSGAALRELGDTLADSCTGTAAVFAGSDDTGYNFCLASRGENLSSLGKEMTKTLLGRGGGKPQFQQGSVKATKEAIEAFFREKFQDL
jgi:hypothetical protein